MSKLDKVMNKLSVLKNVSLMPGYNDGPGGKTNRTSQAVTQFGNNYGNWGPIPDKLFAPWSAPTPKDASSFIAPVQFQRLRHDINMWREAVREAELAMLPFRVRQQRLYVDTVLNPEVQSCLLRRKQLSILRKFDILGADGEPSEDLTAMFEAQWFYDFVSLALDSVFYGYSLIQLGEVFNNDMPEGVDMVRRFNISPDRRCISIFEYAVSGIPFDDENFAPWLVYIPTMTEIGISKCGYGLLYKLANIELYHRQTLMQNADYCEMFVHPFRLAKTDKLEADAERQALYKMLANMGAQSWGVISKQDEIEFISDQSGTGWQSYGDFQKRLSGLIAKLVLGHEDAMQSTTGKLGSSQGQGGAKMSPAAEALSDTQVQDGRLLQHIVNNKLFPKLRELGMDIPEGAKLKYKNDDEILEGQNAANANSLQFAQVLSELKKAGYQASLTDVNENLGITVTPATPDAPDADFQHAQNITNRLNNLYGGSKTT